MPARAVDPKRAAKTPRESAFITRKIVTPDLLNPNGTLFGGIIMAWIDEVAFMSARRFSGRPFVVTASIDNISFVMPLRTGEHVILTSQVNHVGRTSMEIGVKVEREDPYTGARAQATSAYLTFVALDRRGRPSTLPRLVLENDEDRRRDSEAVLRKRVRARMRAYMKRKAALNSKRDQSPLRPPPPSTRRAPVLDLADSVKSGFLDVLSAIDATLPKLRLGRPPR